MACEIRILDTSEGTEVYATGRSLFTDVTLVEAVANRLDDRIEVKLTDPDLTGEQRDALEETQELLKNFSRELDKDEERLETLGLLE